MLGPAIGWLGGSATSLQILLALPMTLDLLGKSESPGQQLRLTYKVHRAFYCSRSCSPHTTLSSPPSA